MTKDDKELIKAAQEGIDVAQTSLGARYYNGWGITKSYKKAFKWFSLAAEKKYAQALFNLGVCYLRGEGVEKNPKRATELFEAAAAQGCTKGLNHRYTSSRNKGTTMDDVKRTNKSIDNKRYMPQPAKDKLAEKMDESSPRAKNKQIKRNEAIERFPWKKMYDKSFEIDVHRVKQLMDKELYGLKTAKRQILRFLAICKRNPSAPLRPLLLLGPPGTGKTVFSKVIADALEKPLKVISMPSLSVGSQFTGSDKYYETAGCGIIVQSIIDYGDCPVFLLDEVDKAGGENSGRHSAPVHGLLNLLDDSRADFRDEFFEVPIDLQNALFILTANDRSCVNRFVLDRCRVVNIEGYKDIEERRIILEDYILPKLYKSYNLTSDDYEIPATAIDLILAESLDNEGGLRTLQSQAESVLQEAVLCMEFNQNTNSSYEVLTPEDVSQVLSEITQNIDVPNRAIGFNVEYDLCP